MSYTVKSSEKLRKSGAETETKALLYLMNFRSDSDDIYYFVVDFFNDLTGMNNMATRLWDVQSKGNHNVGPKAIGRELVTLFKNYMSEFTFETYILFVGSVSGALRKDPSLTVFGIENAKDTAVKLIKEGLVEEGNAKEYIDNSSLTDTNIDAFLKSVLFVIDDDKEPREYVRAIIKQHPNIVPEDKVLDAIFNEIRDKQSSKKNISVVEGVVIETTDEALNYCRHLTNNEIRLMTLQKDIFSASDAEGRIKDIENEITSLKSQLVANENSSQETQARRVSLLTAILGKMNELYHQIDPDGNLTYTSLFTQRNEVSSGSEATVFHLVKLFALQQVLRHNCPIIVDSFRAEDLSTGKEKTVLEISKSINNQVILTTTLKHEELGKYDSIEGVNHINYISHIPSKILDGRYVADFLGLLSALSIKVQS